MRPLVKEIYTELEAFDIYSIYKEKKNSIFLDSGKDFQKLGRYSFIGINEFLTFKSIGNNIQLNDKKYIGDPFRELKKLINKYSFTKDADKQFSDLPFKGGGIGYFSYDFLNNIEYIEDKAEKNVDIPQCYFNFYDNVIVVDNKDRKTFICALGILKNKEDSIREIEKEIFKEKKVKYSDVEMENNKKFEFQHTKEDYMETIEKVRSYIESGDVYITNLTHTISRATDKNPYDVYKDLRYINPAPFAAYMNLESFHIVCSSPERFIKVFDRTIETRPIKGTRPRGMSRDEDYKNKQELLNSEKDKAELLMIVDLERNDLSKVCKPNTVKVTELFNLEEYSTVFHLVSTITGELKDDKDAIDCIEATFPGGSITGAPKIRSMEVIEELEKTKRNIYTGCIGYLGFDGGADFNIVIRTILMKDKVAYFGVGGGITWDSDKEQEYQETIDKAIALMRVL